MKVFLLIGIIYITVFVLHALFLGKTVYGDGMYYFSWVRSIVVDRDIHFQNEYDYFGLAQPLTVNHLLRNIYSIGPAVLWLPWYAMIHTIVRGSGYEFVYQFTVGLSGLIYTLIGLVLVYRILLKYFNQAICEMAIIGISLATNLLYYGSVDPVNTHSLTFFAASVFMTLIIDGKPINWLAAGATYGLLGLIRMQDLIYGLIILPYVNIRKLYIFLLTFFVILTPQLLVWYIFHGNFLVSPYFAENKLFFLPFQPQIIEVLFSPLNGLFMLTPILLFGFLGLLYVRTVPAVPRTIFLIIVCLQIYIVSIRNEWWQEASYSGRMFVSVAPLFTIGLVGTLQQLQVTRVRYIYSIVAIYMYILLNFASIFFYLVSH